MLECKPYLKFYSKVKAAYTKNRKVRPKAVNFYVKNKVEEFQSANSPQILLG